MTFQKGNTYGKRFTTSEEARAAQRASRKAAGRNALARDLLRAELAKMTTDGDGNRVTRKQAGMAKLSKKYESGDLRAIELAHKALGEWVEKVEVNGAPEIVLADFGDGGSDNNT